MRVSRRANGRRPLSMDRLVSRRQLIGAAALLPFLRTAALAKALVVVRPAPELPGDTRYDYYWQLLAAALRATEQDFGPFELKVGSTAMTEARSLYELEQGSNLISILVHGNVAEYERRLVPIRFPLDKGLLGYRVFLIRRETQAQLDAVNDLAGLRQHSIGQGQGWGDVTILRNAGLTVVEGGSYGGLFSMLDAGRFELFSRGVVEVGEELAREQKEHPDLAIERHLMLYYPLTRYFYTSRSPDGEGLARRIADGLERLLKDGSFDQMFEIFRAPFEKQIGFRNRKIIRIENPLETPETPLDRPELWYDPARSG